MSILSFSVASLEESTIKTLQRLVAMQADVNHALFREKPEDLDPYCVYQGQRVIYYKPLNAMTFV
jgi:hypothetical protein